MPARRNALFPLLCLATYALPLAVHGATQSDYMPPPGLYRIDIDSTIKVTTPVNSSLHRMQADGATGIGKASGRKPDGSWIGAGSYRGAALTQCIKPAAAPVAAGSGIAGAACVQRGGAAENGAWVIRQRCAQDDYEITIRKVDSSTWEYKTDVLQKGGGAGVKPQSREAQLLAQLHQQRAQARNAAERAEYDAMLAEYERRTKEEQAASGPSAKAPINAAAQSASGAMTRRIVGLQKWTRIADTCDAAKK